MVSKMYACSLLISGTDGSPASPSAAGVGPSPVGAGPVTAKRGRLWWEPCRLPSPCRSPGGASTARCSGVMLSVHAGCDTSTPAG